MSIQLEKPVPCVLGQRTSKNQHGTLGHRANHSIPCVNTQRNHSGPLHTTISARSTDVFYMPIQIEQEI